MSDKMYKIMNKWRDYIHDNKIKTGKDILSEDVVPGNAPPQKQVHVFDFDDTLGVTDNPNGVMVYNDGKPAHQDEASLRAWLDKNGLTKYLAAPKDGSDIKQVKNRGGWAAYLNSAGLAKIQSKIPKEKQAVTGVKEPSGDGEELLIDFTPSSFVDQKSTKAIQGTINKLKSANSKGSTTAVMTARKGEGSGTTFDGKQVPNTNSTDIEKFLASKGAKPTAGVMGVSGQNKGTAIKDKFGPQNPEEIHFYDDLSKNTNEVEAALAQKTPAELHVYGPGEFAHNEADPNKPTKTLPGSKEKDKQQKESLRKIVGQVIKESLEKHSFLEEQLNNDTPTLDDGTLVCETCLYETLMNDQKQMLSEAEYRGRKVPLGKPMRGDVKKFKVFVRDPNTGNIKKVNFGDPNMKIKKSNPKRRKSFRARHNCKSPGPRTKARYWSCRKW